METILIIGLQIIGLVIIHAAVDYNRSGKSKIKRYSKKWFIMMTLISLGFIIIIHADKWIN